MRVPEQHMKGGKRNRERPRERDRERERETRRRERKKIYIYIYKNSVLTTKRAWGVTFSSAGASGHQRIHFHQLEDFSIFKIVEFRFPFRSLFFFSFFLSFFYTASLSLSLSLSSSIYRSWFFLPVLHWFQFDQHYFGKLLFASKSITVDL